MSHKQDENNLNSEIKKMVSQTNNYLVKLMENKH